MHRTIVLLPADLRRRLEARARRDGVTISRLVRDVLAQFIGREAAEVARLSDPVARGRLPEMAADPFEDAAVRETAMRRLAK